MYSLHESNGRITFQDDLEKVKLSVLSEDCLGLASMTPMPTVNGAEACARAVARPVSGISLEDVARDRKAKTACILVSDASRGVPTALAVPPLVAALTAAGVALRDIVCIVATGVHRPATEQEMREMVGEEYAGRLAIENHTPYDAGALISLGESTAGTPLEMNKKAHDCDLHIVVGKVEPHEFAGFSGGRKSVLPGISSERTILVNHSFKTLSAPEAAPGVLEKNPAHLDMLEAAKRFRVDFVVNFVINDRLEPAAVFAGDLEGSHAAAVDFLRRFCKVSVPERPDVIVTTPGSPLHLDFYQSIKPIIALMDLLEEGMVLALYSECREGVQSDDMLRPFRNTKTLDEAIAYLMRHYTIQMDHALLLAKALQKGVKIAVCSPNVDPADFTAMHMTPCASPQDLLDTACRLSGKKKNKVLFYPAPQKGLVSAGWRK